MISPKHALPLVLFVIACGARPKVTEPVASTGAVQEIGVATPSLSDALPSWNDGPSKQAILEFVRRVTATAPDAVPAEERIAVFDNDGTLWQEKPLAEGAFALDRLEQMAVQDPSLRKKEPFKSALAQDADRIREQGPEALLQILVLTHGNMADDAYGGAVRTFLTTARHPRFGRPYTDLVYQPMIELLQLLESRGFTTYLCSGGDTDFMRVFSQRLYGIPPERVIGSRFEKELATNGATTLVRRPRIEAVNDKEKKPVGIDRQIGRRPIFAAGNVGKGGDVAMLRWTRDRIGPSFAILVHHDDAERESSYGEEDHESLSAARAHGFRLVSMRRDWKRIFPEH